MTTSDRMFPVNRTTRESIERIELPRSVPWSCLNEQHAQEIHGQSLERLAERAGLSCMEIVVNVERLSFDVFRTMKDDYAWQYVRDLVARGDQL